MFPVASLLHMQKVSRVVATSPNTERKQQHWTSSLRVQIYKGTQISKHFGESLKIYIIKLAQLKIVCIATERDILVPCHKKSDTYIYIPRDINAVVRKEFPCH